MVYLAIVEAEWLESKFKYILLCEDTSRLKSYLEIAFADANKSEISIYKQSDSIIVAGRNLANKLINNDYNVIYLGRVSDDYKDIYQIIVRLK